MSIQRSRCARSTGRMVPVSLAAAARPSGRPWLVRAPEIAQTASLGSLVRATHRFSMFPNAVNVGLVVEGAASFLRSAIPTAPSPARGPPKAIPAAAAADRCQISASIGGRHGVANRARVPGSCGTYSSVRRPRSQDGLKFGHLQGSRRWRRARRLSSRPENTTCEIPGSERAAAPERRRRPRRVRPREIMLPAGRGVGKPELRSPPRVR